MSRIAVLPLALILTPFAGAQLPEPSPTPLVGPRSLALSPNGDRIAFTYLGDVWVAKADGGRALPVTSNVEMDDNPVWSPDGRWIAFTSNRTGNSDIFIVSAEGGQPRRLTWFTGSDIPSDWTPDGKSIVLRSARDNPHNGIYTIDVATGRPRQLFLDNQSVGAPRVSPDGKKVLYTRLGFPWVRPRYQGSSAAQLWIYDLASGKREKLRSNGFQHLWANWAADGKSVLAVTVTEKAPSSRVLGKPMTKTVFNIANTPNLYEFALNGAARRRTQFADAGVRFLTAARKADVVAFERDGDVLVSRDGATPEKVVFTANTDDKTAQEERLVLTTGPSWIDLSPKNDLVAFSVRGELWTVPVKKEKGPNADDATQLTTWEGIDEQPLWLPDNKTVYFVSDREGQERLYRMDVTTKETQPVSKAAADVGSLALTPDKKSISFWQTGKNGGLYVVPIEGGDPKQIIWRSGSFPMGYDWSPDGKYVAYTDTLTGSGYYYWEAGSNVFISEVATGKTTNVTKLNSEHSDPRWSPDGKFLFFRSNRSGPGLYVLPLVPEDEPAAVVVMKYEKPKDAVKVTIDWDDIESRPRRLLTQAATNVRIDRENGEIYFLSEGDIWKSSYNGEDVRRVTNGAGVSGFDFSEDGTQIQFLRSGQIQLMELRKPGTPITTVAFRADWTRDIAKERNAAYNEFWREYNRSFYDPNFHGRDWDALKVRYQKFLGSVGHRNEMATVLNMLVGELESSHSEVGSAPGNPPSQSSAHLGLFFDYDHEGPGLKIKEVPFGTPGSYAKTKLSAGETIQKINGKSVSLDEALYRDVLNEQSGRDVVLTVLGADGKTRDVKIRALSSGQFNSIYEARRIALRRKYVEEKSGGKLTYVHIAGMGGSELDKFNRELWMYAQGKKGVVIDVRGNGGGNTSDRLIDILERRQNSIYQVRDEDPIQGPGQALGLPMVVMHNENSASNAEMFPYAMRARGLATLVGMPTPGYVIYTGGWRLVDGTSARMPGTGVYRMDGTPLENMGVEPDHKVELSPEDYFAGKDTQLDKAIEVLLRKAG